VWAFDYRFDVTDDGRLVKLLYVVYEFTREALAMEAERRIDADKVVDMLDRSDSNRERLIHRNSSTEPIDQPLEHRLGLPRCLST